MIRLLFATVENSCHCQMAEAFAHLYGGSGVVAFSAGSKPSRVINPKAIESMAEIGYDLTSHHSKSFAEIPVGPYDAGMTFLCGDPKLDVKASTVRQINMRFLPVLPETESESVNWIRDKIGARVRGLIAQLELEMRTASNT